MIYLRNGCGGWVKTRKAVDARVIGEDSSDGHVAFVGDGDFGPHNDAAAGVPNLPGYSPEVCPTMAVGEASRQSNAKASMRIIPLPAR
jgi:hypothetical protein